MALGQFIWRHGALWVCAMGILVSGTLIGCADYPDARSRDLGTGGSLTFSINWGEADADTSAESRQAPPPRFACGSGGDAVAFVDARLANATHAITLEEDWPCSAGRGTISMVPVGDGYTLTISAYRADGVAVYCVEEDEITVRPGNNDLGVLDAAPFEASGITPAPGASGVNTASVSFRWAAAAGATGYRLLVSESADLSLPIYQPTVGTTSDTPADGILQPDTQYWWAVVPIDFDGRVGALPVDGGYRFSTLPREGPPSDDTYEENDTLASAFDLTPYRGTPLSAVNGAGIVSSDDPLDYFRIDLNPGAEWVFIDCSHTYVNGDVDIALFASDGSLVAEGDSVTDDESIAYHLGLDGGGTYYIGVSLYGDGVSVSNTYDLSFDYTVSTGPSPPVISNIYDNLLDPAAACVSNEGGAFTGYHYAIYFDYDDADGDAGDVHGAYVTVNGMFWSWTEIGGDGADGRVTLSYCSVTPGHSLAVILVDGEGLESNLLSIDLTAYP